MTDQLTVKFSNGRETVITEKIEGIYNLQEANLRGANLRGANLRGANLRGAIKMERKTSS